MPETIPTAPVVPVPPTEPQQVLGTPAAAPQVPAGYVEQARLTGALQKVQELTLSNRALLETNNSLNATLGQLQAQVAADGASVKATAGEHTSILQSLTKERDELKKELEKAAATKLKIRLITEAKRPELFAILDSIPNAADDAAQKVVIDNLGAFAVNIASQREAQLLAGSTPGSNNPQTVTTALPKSDKDWSVYLNTLVLGSPERTKAMDQYFAWTTAPRT
jgi:hypothetical protein